MIKFLANGLKGRKARKTRKSWRRNEDGTTAIEFSFLAMPYILLSLGIIEISLMFAAETLLEGSVTQAARSVKTGQLQQSGAENLEALFRQNLCKKAPVLIKCENILIEARVMESFSDFAAMQPTFDEDGNLVPQGFDAGGSSARILIRAFYRYTAITPLVGELLWGMDRSREFMSTIVLQSEPYDFAAEFGDIEG
jgi:Flp pilus assembly protein TadG